MSRWIILPNGRIVAAQLDDAPNWLESENWRLDRTALGLTDDAVESLPAIIESDRHHEVGA